METLMILSALVVILVVGLGLPVLRVRRDLRDLQDQAALLDSQVHRVRQEVQDFREILNKVIADLTHQGIRGQAGIPDMGMARGDRKEESK